MTITTSKPIPKFPTFGLLPKEETEAAAFLKKHPGYDGRGTVIAILDTGVDPAAVGLQKTTEGKPKIIDIIDCSGSGDVVTKTIVKPCEVEDSNETLHTIVGLSGRTLIIDPTWNNPSGEFHVGIKRAYDLFPEPLVTRLTKERRKKFESEHHKLLVEVQQKLAAWEEAHSPSSTPSESDVLIKTDLEARIEVLKDALKNYNDPGAILDVVVFYDGADWRVVIDVNESGDLRGAPPLTDYRKEFQYNVFSQEDLFSYSVNIHDEGNIVSIVTAAGSHGTHVAAIATAYHPEEPILNGVAPGAQVISLKIGDSRLGSMETGAALARAAIELVERKCDLANMSYGEASAIPDYGHFSKLIRKEVIGKYGCIFLSSAGNSGPALSTTGAPGGTTSDIIGVGAYVNHSMVQAEYALLEPVPERTYTWCSQGPCTDGDLGLTIYAPGSAITSTPTYSLAKSTLMNGTSMSSPNATGCLALLLSGLKAEDKPYTPYRIRNAIVNSAKSIDDQFGIGFIQVQKAWDYLNTFYDRDDQDIAFSVRISNSPRRKRGIYLRGENETSVEQIAAVNVKPKFMREKEPTSGENNTKKFEFEKRLALVSTQPWVRSPDFLLLGSEGRSFEIKVDPTQLSPGGLYYSEVQGYDTTCPDRGPLFRVPVTVAKPIILPNTKVSFDNWSFSPGKIERRFVKVPDGATFADLTFKVSLNTSSTARFWLHMIQLLPQSRFTKHEYKYLFSLGPGSYGDGNSGGEQIEKRRFAVRGGVTIEICLAQFWSSLGNHNVSMEFNFHGIQASNRTPNSGDTIFVNGADPFTRVDFVTPIRREDEVSPSISLDMIRKPLRPTEFSLKPLSPDRDVLPNSRRVYSLILTYKFSITEKGVTISPKFPAFFDLLYDSYFEDFFAIVYDSSKRALGHVDIYPKDIKLETKGDYVIRAQVRHHSQEILEKLNNTTCHLEYGLSKKVSLDVYNQISDVFKSGKSTVSRKSYEKGSRIVYFIGSPADYSVYPKEAKPGDILFGKLNIVNSTRVDGGQYSVNLVVPPSPNKPKEITSNGGENGKEITNVSEFDEPPKPEKTKEEKAAIELNEAIRDLQITHLKKFPAESKQRAELLEELENNHPTHLPILLTKIDLLLESDTGETLSSETANKVLETSDEVLKNINITELAQYYGVKQEGNVSEASKKKKKENEEKKKAVISALRAKAQALAVLADDSSSTAATQLEETYKSLVQWWDATPPTSDFKSLLIYVARERRAGRYGNAIKALNKYLSDSSFTGDNTKDYEKALGIKIELYRDAEFTIWEEYEKRTKLIRIPPGGYSPF